MVSPTLDTGVSDTIICVDEYAVVSHADTLEADTISSIVDDYNDRIKVFNMTFTDKATTDGLPIIIHGLTITQGQSNQVGDWRDAIAGATLYGPDLGQISGVELMGVVDSNTIVFDDSAMIVIPDGNEKSYQLKIWLKEDLSAVSENDTLSFRLCYSDIVTDSVASTIFGKGEAESKGTIIYIERVALEFSVGQPPAIVGLTSKFNVTVRVIDHNNNFSTTANDSIALSVYSGAGLLLSDTGLVQPLFNGSYTWTDVSYHEMGFFRIMATSFDTLVAPVISDSIESVIDEDSRITAGPDSLPTFINSFNCSYDKRIMVMDFTFEDMGTFDGLPTIIEEIIFTPGDYNKIIDWRWAIDSASLYGYGLGETYGVELKTSVDSAEIVFAANNMISIPDGSSRTYQLKLWLKDDLSGIIDRDTFDIKLNYENVKVVSFASSEFESGEVSTGPVIIDIIATKLIFHRTQPPSIVGFNYGFVVTVQAVDDNDNIDRDANDLVSLSLYEGTGQLSSGGDPFTQNLINGTYTWLEAKYNTDEVFRLRVVSAGLHQGISNLIMSKKCVRSALYTYGIIDTDRDFTSLPGSSSCPGYLSIYVPSYAIITGVDVFYSMATHSTPGHRSHQRSQLRCVSPGGTSEDQLYHGYGAQGTHNYQRFNLDIANNVEPGAYVDFELHAGRSSKGQGCGHSFNWVENNTWSVVINYTMQGIFWTGERDSDWNNVYNWGCEVIPEKDFDVIIAADAFNMPVISSEGAEVRDLFIEDGASLTIENGRTLNIYGDLTVDGVLDVESGNGRIAFSGDGSTPTGRQSVKGDAEIAFRDVIVNDKAFVRLEKDVYVKGDLSLNGTIQATTSDDLIFNGHNNVFIIENGGQFYPLNGKVVFAGSGTQKVKSSGERFGNILLSMQNNTDQLLMLDDLTFNNNLFLEKGALNLNRKTLTIGNTCNNAIVRDSIDTGFIFSETEPVNDFANLVKWDIGSNLGEYMVPMGKSHTKVVPMGLQLVKNHMGAEGYLLFSTYGTDPDNTPIPHNVEHLGGVEQGTASPDFIVDRFWYFDFFQPYKEDEGAPIEAYLTMSYLAEELNQVIESSMIAQRYNSDLNQWADLIYTQNNYSAYTAHGFSVNYPAEESGGVGTFQTSYIDKMQLYNVWALTDASSPLPISLLYFDAVCTFDNEVKISWATATETNNHYFTVEKSRNGFDWETVVIVEGAHNSSTRNDYVIFDNLADENITYYRLKQTDFDGIYEIFRPVIVSCKLSTTEDIVIFPNPAKSQIFVSLTNVVYDEMEVYVYDFLGKQVYAKTLTKGCHSPNQEIINVQLNHLADGVYFLKLVSQDFVVSEKFIKKR